jgi:hypothetical protein
MGFPPIIDIYKINTPDNDAFMYLCEIWTKVTCDDGIYYVQTKHINQRAGHVKKTTGNATRPLGET